MSGQAPVEGFVRADLSRHLLSKNKSEFSFMTRTTSLRTS